ncbi:family 10 glycosylhydrolase [bacterium]|nr:family 10 glycosylhydrolase [bacterium]
MTVSPTIHLTDLERCQPAAALATTAERGRWRLFDYESDGLRGTMLVAGEEADAPPVTYPLAVRGWHRISVGLYGERYNGDTVIQVKLTGDPASTILTLKEGPHRSVHELFWKEADLSGQQLVFAPLAGIRSGDGELRVDRSRQAMIAWVKLEPLTPAAVHQLQADRRRAEQKRLFAHNDAHGFVYGYGVRDADGIRREIEPYRDTDFRRLYWEIGMGDLLFYPGKVGRLPTCDGVNAFHYASARVHAECWRAMRDAGTDMLHIAVAAAHQTGLEFHASYRLGGFHWPPPEDHWNGPGFYQQHPELRAVTRDGRTAQRISYAFPETRQFVIALLRDVARYPVDGIALIFVRRPPFVDYEPLLVDGFRQEHQLDPRALPETDERWLRYRGGVMTTFLRELRAALQEVARTQPITITAIVSGRDDENLQSGLLVDDWIAGGLVDTIIPYTLAPDLDSAAEAWPDLEAAAAWARRTDGTACQCSFSMLPRFLSAEEFRTRAAALYGAGATSLFFWDCAYRVNYHDQHAWNAIRRLGHREEIAEWVGAGQPALPCPRIPLVRLGGWNLADDTPG